ADEGRFLDEQEIEADDATESVRAGAQQLRPRSEAEMANIMRSLVRGFPEIAEAYYLNAEHEHAEGVLGLLTYGMSSERRFQLIADVAELSRNVFGEAGAIEVYDDLHEPQSGSWELFQMLVPFYSASDNFDSTVGVDQAAQPRARQSQERLEAPKDENADERRGRKGTWSRFRQKPSKMFKRPGESQK
ncbi:MAG: hypothetical protein KDD44_12995, partial [Bdellovibrionales bacterium]|nr:hypothetical protein [Bdellovibrionales bacterium]